jgi:hypothetical protein
VFTDFFNLEPKPSELPTISFDPTAPKAEDDRSAIEAFRSELVAVLRHEDTLLNHRLQGFLVATAFLLAAFAQFRDTSCVLAGFVGVGGLVLAVTMLNVLRRSARAVQWNITVVRYVESKLYPENMRPNETRKLLEHRANTRRNPKTAIPTPITSLLGVGIPSGAVILWGVLLLWLLAHSITL